MSSISLKKNAAIISTIMTEMGTKNWSIQSTLYYDFQRFQRFSRFLPSLLPFDNPDLRTMVTQRKVVDIKHNEFLPYEVEYSLARVIAQ